MCVCVWDHQACLFVLCSLKLFIEALMNLFPSQIFSPLPILFPPLADYSTSSFTLSSVTSSDLVTHSGISKSFSTIISIILQLGFKSFFFFVRGHHFGLIWGEQNETGKGCGSLVSFIAKNRVNIYTKWNFLTHSSFTQIIATHDVRINVLQAVPHMGNMGSRPGWHLWRGGMSALTFISGLAWKPELPMNDLSLSL